MLTFNEIYYEAQQQLEDDSTATLAVIKRAINQGAKKFGAILNREWRNTNKTFDIVADQQYYQTPEDCIRIKTPLITYASFSPPLKEIPDEDTWNMYNQTEVKSPQPTHYYVRGNDEFGFYPIPSVSITNGGKLNYERRMRDMSMDDYSTETVTVTNGSATVVGDGTTFTAEMVGRSFHVIDPYGDGMWYKIAAYVSGTELELENNYAGVTSSGEGYRIGELPDIPEEFHESLIDYACFRIYTRRKDRQASKDMKALYEEAIQLCKEQYQSKTTSQYLSPKENTAPIYQHPKKEYTVS